MKTIDFDTWKAEYEPRIIEGPTTDCAEHEDEGECECEYLYPFELDELAEVEETAETEQRVWTWFTDGSVVSGIASKDEWYLVTKKPYTEQTEVI